MSKIINDIKKYTYKNSSISSKRKFILLLNYKSFIFLFFMLFLFISTLNAGAPVSNIMNVKINSNLLAQNTKNIQELKESLESELKQILKEIEVYRAEINRLSKQKRTLEQEIQYLNAQIRKTELEIQAIKYEINVLNKRINDTKKAIEEAEKKISSSKQNLTKTLRTYYQLSQKSFIEVVLAEQSLSDYFSNIVYLNKLQNSINEQIDELKKLKQNLDYQKQKLEDAMEEQENLLKIADMKKNELANLQQEKNELLGITKGQEKKYKQLLTEKEKRAAEIRAQLFRLAGGVAPINFGEALKYAELVSKLTGVRPAFLLAVLKQESDLGRNVGQCYLTDPETGAGINIKTGQRIERVMNPNRDVPVFLELTKKLGLDPYNTPVSCPMSFGWGGAMGPAQFIPSTWKAYEDKIAKLVGETPNPWNIYHAFVAAGVKLAQSGANKQTYEAEWRAAMIYFAGSNWSNPAYRFYGDSVMSIAEKFEQDIKIIKEAGG
jgi:peptidoglycan hydrolase CwlO-like protein